MLEERMRAEFVLAEKKIQMEKEAKASTCIETTRVENITLCC
jgi:hypothetical protein